MTNTAPAIPADLPVRTHDAVLALDLGTTTGWALRTMDGRIVSGTHDFRPRRFEGGGMRYLRFTDWLVELAMLSHGIRRVVFEEVRRHVGTDAAHIYGGFMGALTSWCEEHEVPYQGHSGRYHQASYHRQGQGQRQQGCRHRSGQGAGVLPC